MPFDIRCPSCSAKLRLDEEPKPRSIVECPKCGNKFPAPARAVSAKPAEPPPGAPPKPSGEDTKRATGVKVQSKQRVHMNEFKLLGIVGGVMLAFILVLAGILWILGRAAKVEDMLAMLPNSCNNVRGVNYAQMKKYPGYKSELDKFYANEVKDAFEKVNAAAGEKGADEWLNYFLIGRDYFDSASEGQVVLFNVKKKLDPAEVAKGLNAKALERNGVTFYRMPADGGGNSMLRNAVLYFPNDTNVLFIKDEGLVIRTPGQQPISWAGVQLDSAIAYKTDKREDRIPGQIGTAGKLAIRGHVWQVIRPTGQLKGYGATLTASMAKDNGLSRVYESGKNVGAIGIWTTIGGRGVRFGFAIELNDAEQASGLVKAVQDGPMGKGDESEVPNGLKQGLPVAGQTEFKEFLQNLSFKSKSAAAYLTSKIETGPEKARSILALFNGTAAQKPAPGGGGFPGPGGPGMPGPGGPGMPGGPMPGPR